MRKQILAIAFLAMSLVAAGQQTLNNDAIVKMVKAGFSDDLIITTVNGVPGHYDTSVDGLIALKSAGVSEKVVAAIVAKASAPAAAPVPVVAAADPNDPASPHDPGIYMMLHDGDGKPKMVRLEQKESDTGPSLSGYSQIAKIPGAQAEHRTSESKPVFYFYFPSSSGITDSPDPSQFPLLLLLRKKDHRETEIGHQGFRSWVDGLNQNAVIPCSAEKLRPNVYKVTTDVPLAAREYAFAAAMKLNETGSASFFDFGVDDK